MQFEAINQAGILELREYRIVRAVVQGHSRLYLHPGAELCHSHMCSDPAREEMFCREGFDP